MNKSKQSAKNQTKPQSQNIDWMITLLPLVLIIGLCILFFCLPEQSNVVLGKIRFLFGDTFGVYYLSYLHLCGMLPLWNHCARFSG